jgi:hypothetical protein
MPLLTRLDGWAKKRSKQLPNVAQRMGAGCVVTKRLPFIERSLERAWVRSHRPQLVDLQRML